ncbi:FHA domain-containing protein [Streptomyces sp. NBC_00243]|uniref:FHA domain-containing protein n=1 Tax=Streptomyces sp. NBC_00243 TaxID=2975688 RepID=UPI002DD81B40|nr:FHA domain-containing protein [Streptomyces sp. NBC_00243]WRZ22108.1 FHA domain-containing protein [Streptomyces sp. NBC_00243]
MQIRLTVVDPLGPPSEPRGRAAVCDVLVTAPAGTALAAVASALASAVGGSDSQVVLYAGAERLDAQRCTVGEPPLTDGAVLSLGSPAEPGPDVDDVAAQLQVIAGPDAGGVHLLHGGQIRIGRSADADVPLDDPDVSRLHCAVTVTPEGRVSVADLGSTNGTTLNGTRVGTRPVRFAPGALLRVGESALRLAPPGVTGSVGTTPDGEGHVRVTVQGDTRNAGAPADAADRTRPAPTANVPHARVGGASQARTSFSTATGTAGDSAVPPEGETHHGYGSAEWGAAGGVPAAQDHGPVVPEQGGAPRIETRGSSSAAETPRDRDSAPNSSTASDTPATSATSDTSATSATGTRKGTPPRGTDVPSGVRKRSGLGAWARRLTGGRAEPSEAGQDPYDEGEAAAEEDPPVVTRSPESWPDPAALLLTALGPGPRLWERGPGHPEALTVRLGTADRAAPDGSGLLPAVPVTADLREAGALGLAGPRERLTGLARAVVAQLAALHSPDALEIVLISTDRSRTVEERTAEWSWLGWLPHLRPTHGQDCRLLLAYDREQATARTEELLRRLDDHPQTPGAPRDDAGRAGARRPSWARDEDPADGAFDGPYTVVVVDGDPGGADVRESVARLAHEGSRAGIHVICLAETASASPASPVRDTYEAACETSPAFRECGAVALLSGDVATALRLLRVAQGAPEGPEPTHSGSTRPGSTDSGPAHGDPSQDGSARTGRNNNGSTHGGAAHAESTHFGSLRPSPAHLNPPHTAHTHSPSSGHLPRGPVGRGTVAAVDAVSVAWAERFARALAPLRTDGAQGERHTRVSVPLPHVARLLDELGLARATPASLMARWADAGDDAEALGGRGWAVLGAGPRGPVCVDLAAEGPHLLIEGPSGSGRTELLRSIAASLAAAERPDRLGIVLIDGRDGTGSSGEGLRVCTDLPHVTTHLAANDPVRMREFAQSLSAELKRRAELLGRLDFTEWHTRREVSGRMVTQRSAGGGASGAGDLDAPPSSTLRLRPAAARERAEPGPPLARLVVVVDDLDALLSPALGSLGRPSAGSVVRALEAVAREGERLGVHLVAAAGVEGRTSDSELARAAAIRVTLDEVSSAQGPDEPAPGRGHLLGPDGRVTPFQAGRVTGRIPRTATLRPTVVPLEWHRMGDPPARRPVRELGNGPTDLALLASALERAARSVSATEVPSLL